jgi:steroid 5-alpha reductase family enzyme
MSEAESIWSWGIFLGITVGLLAISKHSIRDPRAHGFFRFFLFESVAGVIVLNAPEWFVEPFAWNQLLSWTFLGLSIAVFIESVHLLQLVGHSRPRNGNAEKKVTPAQAIMEREQFGFEKTTNLVQSGLYRYIRHPMYSSLLFLGWGAFLKEVTWTSVVVCVLVTVFAFLTAIADERECIVKFGDEYRAYMKKTRRFIPFLV